MNSFIVPFWSGVFGVLGRISLFGALRYIVAPSCVSARLVDAWVLGHLILAFTAFIMLSIVNIPFLYAIFVVYGLFRVFEISVYQANVLLFDEYRALRAGKSYALKGYRRLVLLLLHNYAEIIIWFACTYTYLTDEFLHKWERGTGTLLGGIYSSFVTMTTFGEFDLSPRTRLAALVLMFHAAVGLFMTILSLARFISLLPQPKSNDIYESEAHQTKNDVSPQTEQLIVTTKPLP